MNSFPTCLPCVKGSPSPETFPLSPRGAETVMLTPVAVRGGLWERVTGRGSPWFCWSLSHWPGTRSPQRACLSPRSATRPVALFPGLGHCSIPAGLGPADFQSPLGTCSPSSEDDTPSPVPKREQALGSVSLRMHVGSPCSWCCCKL